VELRIDLLGGFCVAAGTQVVAEGAWRLRKARTLLKLLALSPEHSLHREQAIEALWPNVDVAAGSNNLRQALYVARRALDSCGEDGAQRLDLSHDVLTLTNGRLRIDVEAFESAVAAAAAAGSIEAYRNAAQLYTGELLPEDRFDEWAVAKRRALRERHLGLLVELARLSEDAGDHAAAAAALQQAVLEEPLHEHAHRELMRIYALTGRRQRALAQFHLLRESLRREVEDEPDETTRRLYRDILTRQPETDAAPEPAPAARRQTRARQHSDNLPLQLTSFVGRERELREVIGLARRHRLLTLTGPGGAGKTRLALEAARELIHDAPDGVWLVELAGLSDAALVPDAVAAALGVESRSARPSEQAIAAHVDTRAMVILLDNCEHLVGACAGLAEHLLTRCPNLRMLATSREPLHASGEVNWRVPSLSPREAATLFADRAAGVSSSFALSRENEAAVAEICTRVDGIPLAVELAAARVGVLAPAQIAERLRDSFAVLAAGRRTALTRQQTLAGTLDWSHELLDAEERRLFRRLGTFAGSVDLEAVEFVCEGSLDVLARLVDKSLVVVEDQEGASRYRLLETMRQYARERLAQAGEEARLQALHRERYLRVAETLEPDADDAETRARFSREVDELRWALRTALRADPDVALRMAAALWRFWHDRGDLNEGARWLEAALKAAPAPSVARARALHGLSVVAMRTSNHRRATATATEAVDFYRSSGDKRTLSEELHHLGTLAWVFVDFDGAERSCAESQRLAAATGEASILASVLHTLGVIETSRGRSTAGRELIGHSVRLLRELPPDAPALLLPVAVGYGRTRSPRGIPQRRFLEQTFVTARRVKPPAAVGYALCDLALASRQTGDTAAAQTLLEEALSLFRSRDDDLGSAQAMCLLGNLHSDQSEHEVARELHDESLALREAAHDARGIGLSLLAIAVAGANAEDPGRAWAAAERARELFDRTDDGPGRAAAVMQLGYLARDAGRTLEAQALQLEALKLWTDFNPHIGWCSSILLELAELEALLGDPEQSRERFAEALEACRSAGDDAGIAYCQEMLSVPVNGVLTPD
jgi:predicted ATPase/DNA-binding SARP family transcriptional activator